MVKFVAPNDPRFLSTLAVIEERLVTDSLVFRYDVEARARRARRAARARSRCARSGTSRRSPGVGRLDDARLALEKMFTYANHLGLYAEQIGLTGEQLGNFPQAFTHLALISAAINLDRELGVGEATARWPAYGRDASRWSRAPPLRQELPASPTPKPSTSKEQQVGQHDVGDEPRHEGRPGDALRRW